MFYIIVYGSWGNCIVSDKGEATWDIENAMLFKSYSEACQYINDTWKSWGADADCFRVYKKGGAYD
jgi:hypothetical protein